MDNGSVFRNFTRMGALDFELLATITGPKDTNYRKSVTVNGITYLGLLIP
jgi:hypothetical protein